MVDVNRMPASAVSTRPRSALRAKIACAAILFHATASAVASAAGCAFEPQGEGRVMAVIDARSFRLQDGREVRLAGIEADTSEDRAGHARALAAILNGREVSLHGEDDAPDRYGRQTAFVFLVPSETLVQEKLLAQGAAIASAAVTERACASLLLAAEAAARQAKQGIWASPSVIKNSETPGDILAGTGRFTLVEGKVLTVRQAGATTYLNFGRNWTRDFAVTIPKRVLPVLEAAGMAPKSLENRWIRVRGFVEARGGPRIEVLRVGQIELLGGK
jgi:endonuclease YncB( thermonuclease family)